MHAIHGLADAVHQFLKTVGVKCGAPMIRRIVLIGTELGNTTPLRLMGNDGFTGQKVEARPNIGIEIEAKSLHITVGDGETGLHGLIAKYHFLIHVKYRHRRYIVIEQES